MHANDLDCNSAEKPAGSTNLQSSRATRLGRATRSAAMVPRAGGPASEGTGSAWHEAEDDPLSDGSVCGVFGRVGPIAFDPCCALSAVQFRAGDVATSSHRERIERQVA